MDIHEVAVTGLKSAAGMFAQDLKALPADAFTRSFGQKCRTVADIVYEVNLVNDHIGLAIRGEELFDWPEGAWIKAPTVFTDKNEIIEAFRKSSGKMIETAEAMTVEDLEGTVETEFGPKTRFERCRFVAWHISYHSGQLNFIQTLLGDDGWHWS